MSYIYVVKYISLTWQNLRHMALNKQELSADKFHWLWWCAIPMTIMMCNTYEQLHTVKQQTYKKNLIFYFFKKFLMSFPFISSLQKNEIIVTHFLPWTQVIKKKSACLNGDWSVMVFNYHDNSFIEQEVRRKRFFFHTYSFHLPAF